MKNILNKFFGIAFCVVVLAACEDDFLERPPQAQIVDANFYQTDDQVLAATGLLYNQVWFTYNQRASFTLGDLRAGTVSRYWNDRDIVEFATSGTNQQLSQAWTSFFVVVNQANMALNNIETYAGEDVRPEIKDHAFGEARFMRSWAYRYLVMNWGPVPIIENTLEQLNDTTIAPNTIGSVWKFIIKDFRAAAELLPEQPIEVGRLTKWSAEAALAKAYLDYAGVDGGGSKNQVYLDSAMYYADRVINMSGASLVPEYRDLFMINPAFGGPYDNNEESLFELQWVFAGADVWGLANAIPSFMAFSTDIGNDDGWGGDFSATMWMLNLYDGFIENGNTVDQRLHETFMLPGSRYPEISQDATDSEGNRIQQPLEVPYQGESEAWNNVFIKKYIGGQLEDYGTEVATQRYPNNTYMIRLADMYLTYAEAALGNSDQTTDPTAVAYFSTIRERAGLSEWLLSSSDPLITANGPLTFDDILEERMREFAMEHTAWYDFVRLQYWNPSRAYSMLSNQDRGFIKAEPNQMPDPTSWTILEGTVDNRTFTCNEGNFYLPIPDIELAKAPNLRRDPVDYFSN